jgi:RNA polymerase sigma-70 factor, ECF subfamily
VNENSTDELLLEAAKAGDQEAFLLLFKRYHAPVFRFLYRFLGSEEAAEDITHDCFLELIKNREDSRFSQHSLLTLLYAKARKLAWEQLHPLEQPQRAEVTEESIETVKQAISGLPPLERETLILFEYEGLLVNEIAAIVEADDEIVAGRLMTARQRLQSALSRYFS